MSLDRDFISSKNNCVQCLSPLWMFSIQLNRILVSLILNHFARGDVIIAFVTWELWSIYYFVYFPHHHAMMLHLRVSKPNSIKNTYSFNQTANIVKWFSSRKLFLLSVHISWIERKTEKRPLKRFEKNTPMGSSIVVSC